MSFQVSGKGYDGSGLVNFSLGQDVTFDEVNKDISHTKMVRSFCRMSIILLDQNLQRVHWHKLISSKFQVVLLC